VLSAALIGSIVLVPVAIALFIYGDLVMRFVYGSEWTGHGFAIMCIVLAMMMHIAGYALSRGLFAIERADLDLLANIAPVIVLLTLGIVLVRAHSVDGAAISFLVAQTSAMLVRLLAFTSKARRETPARLTVELETVRGAA
jgi:O-antigen/teichoic acid export membrane protein